MHVNFTITTRLIEIKLGECHYDFSHHVDHLIDSGISVLIWLYPTLIFFSDLQHFLDVEEVGNMNSVVQ